MFCRVCGRPNLTWNADNTPNRDHDLCDAIIAERTVSLIPDGMTTREYRAAEDDALRAEYERRSA